jgi:P27 family predicted phage terminase small subunit
MLEGNPGHRPLNHDEPTLDVQAPARPEFLSEAAETEWDRIVPILLQMRLLTEADGIALAMLCQSYADYLKANDDLRRTGLVMRTKTGYVTQNPLIAIARGYQEMYCKLMLEFGLTPSSRVSVATVGTGGKKSKNKWANLG